MGLGIRATEIIKLQPLLSCSSLSSRKGKCKNDEIMMECNECQGDLAKVLEEHNKIGLVTAYGRD